jgi:hypothetical protein
MLCCCKSPNFKTILFNENAIKNASVKLNIAAVNLEYPNIGSITDDHNGVHGLSNEVIWTMFNKNSLAHKISIVKKAIAKADIRELCTALNTILIVNC